MSISMKRGDDGQHAGDISVHLPRTLAVYAHLNARADIRYLAMSLKQDIEKERKYCGSSLSLRASPHFLGPSLPPNKLVLFNMAAIAGLRTAASMLYYSAQRYDPQLRQQQQQQATLLPTTPLILLGHLPTSFTASRIIYPPSVFPRYALSTHPGTPTLLSRNGSTTSSSNRGSSSRWYDEYSGRVSALTNTTIFESDETSLHSHSFGGDDPVSAKEPNSEEQQTPSIGSALSAMQHGARVTTPPPSSVIRQYDDTVEETDKNGKGEILEQVSSVPELPDLAMETSNSPSNILDQHPEYDSLYDYSEDDGTISDFFMGQEPDDEVGDTYSFGQSISMSDVQASVYSNRANDASSTTRPPSVVSSSESPIRFRPIQPSSAPSVSSIRFRPMESRQQPTILPGVYKQRAQVISGGSTSFNPYSTAVPSRRVTFADPVPVPSSPTPQAHKAVTWWKIKQHKKILTRFHFGPSRRQRPESRKPDAPSQPICSAANSIATLDENVETHRPQPPSRPRSPVYRTRHRRTRVILRKMVSPVLPRIAISQEPEESEEAEPKEKPRSNGIFSNPLGRWWKKNKNNADEVRDMVEVKPLQVQVERRVVVH